MDDITLAQTHALLERLAEYVMNEVPTRKEMNEKFVKVDERLDKMDKRFDAVDKQLAIIRTEQAVFTKTFDLHNKRLDLLEDDSYTYRIRDKGNEQSSI